MQAESQSDTERTAEHRERGQVDAHHVEQQQTDDDERRHFKQLGRDFPRALMQFGLAIQDSAPRAVINAAIAVLQRIADDESRVLKDPAPLIKVESLGDSSVNILFRVWTARSDWWGTKLDLVQRCKEGLEAGGCSIPFPQRDVHLFQDAAAAAQVGTGR